MKCRNCPYGKEDFEKRMYWYQKIVNEQGIPNDIYHDLKPEDVADEFEQFVWCNKVDGKVYWAGHCTDFYENADELYINRSKRKRSNKRERDEKYKNRLKFLNESCNYYPSPVIYTDEIWIKGYGYMKNPKPYYKRMYRDNHKGGRYGYYKKYANRVVRRYKGEIGNGCAYKKCFDYWWTVD